MGPVEPTLDVLETLRLDEAKKYAEWKAALDDLMVKQDALELARRAYTGELAARMRLGGIVR